MKIVWYNYIINYKKRIFCYHQQELITRLTQKTSRSIVFILILNEGLMQLLKEASQREFQVGAFTPLLME